MPSRPQRIAARLAVGLCSFAGACDGPGNSGVYAPDPNLVRDVPWLNGVMPAVESGVAVVPPMAVYPSIGFGLPDPGSQRTDCSTVGDYDFSTGWFDSFELHDKTDPSETTGVAAGWASYDDLSKYAFHAPGDATWYPGLAHTFHGLWGLPAERLPGPSCDGKPNDWVLHFRGGLFRKWGAGISHAFMDPVGQYRDTAFDDCKGGEDFCPATLSKGAPVDGAGLPATAKSGADYLQSHQFIDASSYDGVAFWARRGPEGFDRALVILTDKFTSGRLARENQKFCRRVRECHTRCLSGTPCSPDNPAADRPTYRCWDPKDPRFATPAGPQLPVIPIETQMDQMFPRCGPSACTSPSSYADPDFDGKQCRPYSYPAAEESGEYCFDPGDPPPPGRDERCQDGWQSSVPLTLDWKFFAIPFSQFAQAGFGKRAPFMDLESLDTLAFGAVMGWSDLYFDNVTLYRRKK
jgi:hypothetical protein